MSKPPNFFLRSTDGQVVEVPSKFKYLEIRSVDGLVTHVFAVEDGSTIMFTKDDPESAKYQGSFKDVKFGEEVSFSKIKEQLKHS